ncbi:MAG: hypothetical protein M1826_001585 [Phylliscum demangeonii]|nr:MAG: hypothetical protein M1826_001585 [Phylliscum demangeonii]
MSSASVGAWLDERPGAGVIRVGRGARGGARAVGVQGVAVKRADPDAGGGMDQEKKEEEVSAVRDAVSAGGAVEHGSVCGDVTVGAGASAVGAATEECRTAQG